MRQLRILAALTAIVLSACGSSDPEPSLITYGTSYVAGHFGTPPKNVTVPRTYLRPFVDQTARALGLPVVNHGVSGSRSPNTLSVVDSTWPAGYHDPKGTIVIVECELNDLRRYGLGGLPTFRSDLAEILARLDSGRPRPKVGIVLEVPILAWSFYPPFNNGSDAVERIYNTAAALIARRADAVVVNPLPGWRVATMISVDGVHPSRLGSRHIALAAEHALR